MKVIESRSRSEEQKRGSISLITQLVIGVAGLSASSSKADTLNSKNCGSGNM